MNPLQSNHKLFNSSKQKDQLVLEKVISRGYSPEQFITYAFSQPQLQNFNFQSCPLNLLKLSIEMFILHKQEQKKKVSSSDEISSFHYKLKHHLERCQLLKSIETKDFNLYSRPFALTDHGLNPQFYLTSVKCSKNLNQKVLNAKTLTIQITSSHKNEGGILHRDFMSYTVRTKELKWQVQRRYSDFQWLRDILQYSHQGIVIPPLPQKRIKGNFSQTFIKKRSITLEIFLRKIVLIDQLKHDQNLLCFLEEPNSEQFLKILKQSSKLDKKPLQHKSKTLSGQLHYGLTPKIIQTIKASATHFDTISPMLLEVYKQAKNIRDCLSSCIGSIEKINNSLDLLGYQEKTFLSEILQLKGQLSGFESKNTFKDMSLMINQEKQYLESMKNILQEEFYLKFKYEYHHAVRFSQKFKQVSALQKKCSKLRNDIILEKDKIYQKKDISKWPISQFDKNNLLNRGQKPYFSEVGRLIKLKKQDQLKDIELQYGVEAYRSFRSVMHYMRLNDVYMHNEMKKYLANNYQNVTKWRYKLDRQTRKLWGQDNTQKSCHQRPKTQTISIIDSNSYTKNTQWKYTQLQTPKHQTEFMNYNKNVDEFASSYIKTDASSNYFNFQNSYFPKPQDSFNTPNPQLNKHNSTKVLSQNYHNHPYEQLSFRKTQSERNPYVISTEQQLQSKPDKLQVKANEEHQVQRKSQKKPFKLILYPKIRQQQLHEQYEKPQQNYGALNELQKKPSYGLKDVQNDKPSVILQNEKESVIARNDIEQQIHIKYFGEPIEHQLNQI